MLYVRSDLGEPLLFPIIYLNEFIPQLQEMQYALFFFFPHGSEGVLALGNIFL
jgi:hypothetical protein